jgi:hypothetical protein
MGVTNSHSIPNRISVVNLQPMLRLMPCTDYKVKSNNPGYLLLAFLAELQKSQCNIMCNYEHFSCNNVATDVQA